MLEIIDFGGLLGLFDLNFKDILNYPSIVLIAFGVFWLVFASWQDFKRREVENWWSFSLIALVLAFRLFFSVERGNYWFFAWGLIGLIVGFAIANLLYYGRMFAGGDFKLLLALFCVLPFSLGWRENVFIFIGFFVLMIFAGGVYGLIYSFIMACINFKRFSREFSLQIKKNKILLISSFVVGLLVFFGFRLIDNYLAIIISLLILLSAFLFVFAKAVENSCLIKEVYAKELTIGDWLVNKVKVKRKIIKPDWQGLSEEDLKFLVKNYKGKIIVKNGIPFIPAFLIAFAILILILRRL
jgi:Flp pilus assembly protein protease CpaA